MRQHYAFLTPAHPGYPNAGVSLVGAGGRINALGVVDQWVGRVGGLVVCWDPTLSVTMANLHEFTVSGGTYGTQ